MFAENAGSISFSTSCPSNSDHISPTVSSPTRVTTPPASSRMASTQARLARQSSRVRVRGRGGGGRGGGRGGGGGGVGGGGVGGVRGGGWSLRLGDFMFNELF